MRTDTMKLKGTCRNFSNVSKNHSQFKEIKLFFSVCCTNFRDILVTNGNRGSILKDKKVWVLRSVLQLHRLGRNTKSEAREHGFKPTTTDT